jgi:hypothetical protein
VPQVGGASVASLPRRRKASVRLRGVTEALANRREGATECRSPEAMAHNPFFRVRITPRPSNKRGAG